MTEKKIINELKNQFNLANERRVGASVDRDSASELTFSGMMDALKLLAWKIGYEMDVNDAGYCTSIERW